MDASDSPPADTTARTAPTAALDLLQARALDALPRDDHADARDGLIRWADAAIEEGQPAVAANALTWLSLDADYETDPAPIFGLIARVSALPLDAVEEALVKAAAARLSAHLPVESPASVSGLGSGLLTWQANTKPAQDLSSLARRVGADIDAPIAEQTLRAAWRSTHRTPAVLAERAESSSVDVLSTVDSGIDIARSIYVDLSLWAAVDALESGDRARRELLLRRARSQVLLGVPAHQAWWVATTTFLSLWLDGEFEAARAKMDEAFALGSGIGHPGALAVFLTQRWFLGELAGNHDEYNELSREQSTQMRHALSALGAGLSEMRGGDIVRAQEWARRAERHLQAERDEETSWLVALVLAADLATGLIRAGSVDGATLADFVRPEIAQWTDRVAVDSRGIGSVGPVARASADLALALGDTTTCQTDIEAAEVLLDRLGWPAVNVAELLLVRIRLAIALDQPAADDLATLLSMTASPSMAFLHRQGRSLAAAAARSGTSGLITAHESAVLDLLVDGLTNPQIADRLGYSLSKISKDVMVITRKLGVTNRVEAAQVWAEHER